MGLDSRLQKKRNQKGTQKRKNSISPGHLARKLNIVLCTFNLCLLSRGKQLICEQLYLNRKLAGSNPMGTHLFKFRTKNTRTTSMDLSQAKLMKVGVQFCDAGPHKIFLEDIGKIEYGECSLQNSKILCLPKLPSFEDRILPNICRLVPFK